MVPLVSERQEGIRDLCRRYKVQRLELFGSALEGDKSDLDRSDLDFLVEFLPLEPGEHADMYFGLLEALGGLFERPVDLVMTTAIRNPYFLELVNQGRTVLYAA